MTLLVVTAVGSTPDALAEAARDAAAHADWVEVRLDGPSGLPWDLRPFFLVGKPCIATMRHADEGGATHADDRTRADVLRRALKAGARAIDVEWTSTERDALVAEAHAAGARVILSRHALDACPDADEILDELRAMREAGADWCKLATTCGSARDAEQLVRAATAARDARLPYALMAIDDAFLRLMAPTLGMALVYAAPERAAPAVRGQLPASRVRATHAQLATPARAATGATRGVFLLGHPVSHSASPAMQDAAFAASGVDARYLALDVEPGRFADAIALVRDAGALGANVTIPHKESALALVDEADEAARASGAVNAIAFRDGRARGTNTDGAGALDALKEVGARIEGETALVLGAGGAARGIAHALKTAGATVVVVNRTVERAQALAKDLGVMWLPAEEIGKIAPRARVIVNATSIGMHDDALPIDLNLVTDQTILDAVYRKGGTRLVRDARARGLLAVGGDAMLLHQGARSFTFWTGKPAPLAAMRAALAEVLS